jgi:hypothetical protein
MIPGYRFNPAPGWPLEPDWVPPDGWTPDSSWPPAPAGWEFWVEDDTAPEVEDVPIEISAPVETVAAPADDPLPEPEPGPTPEPAPAAEAATGDAAGARGELAGLQAQIAKARDQRDRLLADIRAEAERDLRAQLVELNDAVTLQAAGVYEYHHPLESADAYKERLADLQVRIKAAITEDRAILASSSFSLDNSLAKGRRMVADLGKLMLRAYNAEADNCVRSLRAGALVTASKRLEAAAESIARLGHMMDMRISPEYHALRIEELELTADYLAKVAEEREKAREERERLREEAKAERELAAERERLDKERSHYVNALQALADQGKEAESADLQARLDAIDKAIEFNDYRAANIRAGYVYVISNVGAFGADVVKIGLTRRLEPMDRVRELGDASVPFPFDVHALFFADDAVGLETTLHQAFADRKVNQVNHRREFFFATPHQVREILAEAVGSLLEFTEQPVATEYFQSKGAWPESAGR